MSDPPMSDADPPSHYEAIGGKDAVLRLAEQFYDVMEQTEPELAALHQLDADGKVSRRSRDRFGSFLVFWLGGPDDYPREHGHPRLRMRHATVPVDVAMRDAWLRCMARAQEDCGVEPEIREFLGRAFGQVADFLRNRPG